MKLLIDSGNSLVKIAVVEHQTITKIITTSLTELSTEVELINMQDIEQILLANSRQDLSIEQIRQIISEIFNYKVSVIKSQAHWQGVTNSYLIPEQLGIDRWLGLIFAWYTYKTACVIISCGTFITYDVLDNNGNHLGGAIMLGLRRNKSTALRIINNDAGISKSPLVGLPTDTKSAIDYGGELSFIGTINHLINLKPTNKIIITGGDAALAQAQINADLTLVKNIPLKGLLIIANSNDR